MKALTQDGMLSISDIPGYASQRMKTLQNLHKCAILSSATREHTFTDGTTRLTMATHTVSGPGGQQVINHNVPQDEDKKVIACDLFSSSSDELRRIVNKVTLAFSNQLASLIDVEVPLLSMKNNDYEFDTFSSVVENGEHLEHFHSYHRNTTDTKSAGTIKMHTDQGLFIAFAPALMVDLLSDSTSVFPSKGDFYIETQDGLHHLVEFYPNDLVIMLGDGVNQYVNPKMRMPSDRYLSLRATPHSLTMKGHDSNHARVWYGRMVLPPSEAIHPTGNGKTFGDLRQLMIKSSLSSEKDKDILGLGCSGSNQMAHQLEEVVCASGSMYCWHRCMEYSDYNISEDMCAKKDMEIKCVNPRGQLYQGGHGDYFPDCSDSTEPAGPYPTLDDYPASKRRCDEDAWEKFSSSKGYKFVTEKLGDNGGNRGYDWEGFEDKGGNTAKFMWNVNGDEIEGQLVFNGLHGFLAMGFANPGGGHNGMNGASIIMALPGGDYTAKEGLDMDTEGSVQEYVINLKGSAFRHWSEPLEGRDLSGYDFESNECFTALTFKTKNINNIKFNTDGTDDLVWSANGQDSFCGYHGRGGEGQAGDRDRFAVEWKTGKVYFPLAEEYQDEAPIILKSKEVSGGNAMMVSLMTGVILSLVGVILPGIF